MSPHSRETRLRTRAAPTRAPLRSARAQCSRLVDAALFEVLPVAEHAALPDIGWRRDGANIELLPASAMNLRYVAGRPGCVHVAESVMCPPNHAFDDDDPAARDAALARRAAELKAKPVTKQAVNVDGDKIERIGAIIDEIAKS